MFLSWQFKNLILLYLVERIPTGNAKSLRFVTEQGVHIREIMVKLMVSSIEIRKWTKAVIIWMTSFPHINQFPHMSTIKGKWVGKLPCLWMIIQVLTVCRPRWNNIKSVLRTKLRNCKMGNIISSSASDWEKEASDACSIKWKIVKRNAEFHWPFY